MGKDSGPGGIRLVQGWALSAPAGTQWGQWLGAAPGPLSKGRGGRGRHSCSGHRPGGAEGPARTRAGLGGRWADGQAGPGLAGHLRADIGAQVPSARGGGLSLGAAGTRPETWAGGLFGLQLQGQSSRHCDGGSGASDPVSSDVVADGGHSLSSSRLYQHWGTSTGLLDTEPGTPAPWGLGSRPARHSGTWGGLASPAAVSSPVNQAVDPFSLCTKGLVRASAKTQADSAQGLPSLCPRQRPLPTPPTCVLGLSLLFWTLRSLRAWSSSAPSTAGMENELSPCLQT